MLLLDRNAWTSRGETIEEDDAALLIRLFAEALRISMEELRQFDGEGRIDCVLNKAISLNLLPPGIEVTQARTLLEIYRANVRAMEKYVPQPYPGAVTLFKAPKSLSTPPPDGSARSKWITKMIQDPTMGWGELAAGGVRIVDVPGSHLTMVGKPHVEILAQRIRDCLNEAETADVGLMRRLFSQAASEFNSQR